MIRYFGFLSNRLRGRLLPILHERLETPLSEITTFTFAAMMKRFLNINPYKCILCGHPLVFSYFERGMHLNTLILSIKGISKLRI